MFLIKREKAEHWEMRTDLLCIMYCAFCICSCVPVMWMMRSLEPGKASSIVTRAPESSRTWRMRHPPLPMIAPANYSKAQTANCTLLPINHKKYKQYKITLAWQVCIQDYTFYILSISKFEWLQTTTTELKLFNTLGIIILAVASKVTCNRV